MTNNNFNNQSNCLCCSGKTYLECCKPLHSGEKHASTAEQLMRSRYSAFAMNNSVYIQMTWDKNTCPKSVELANDVTQWERLEIIQTKNGTVGDNKGLIHFKAYYTQNGQPQILNEISRFVKKSSRWYYLDGTVKSVSNPNQQTTQGKNAPCSCGSGKKFKRCCGKAELQSEQI